jgi:hypothetical protein
MRFYQWSGGDILYGLLYMTQIRRNHVGGHSIKSLNLFRRNFLLDVVEKNLVNTPWGIKKRIRGQVSTIDILLKRCYSAIDYFMESSLWHVLFAFNIQVLFTISPLGEMKGKPSSEARPTERSLFPTWNRLTKDIMPLSIATVCWITTTYVELNIRNVM